MANRYTKDPSAVLDYQWDWSSWMATDDTISTASVTAEAGLTVDSTSNTTTAVTAWLSGGTAGVSYDVTCRITTVDGRTDDRTIRIVVAER